MLKQVIDMLIMNKLKVLFIVASCLLSHSVIAANCLYVSSYHVGYEWNDGVEEGIEKTLKNDCHLDKFYMDTKRNPSPEFAKNMALKAREHIEKTNPDVIIACDDNASKYLIKPYYKDSTRPFVFCGINWSAEEYGYPYPNVTGMIEVSPIRQLLKVINKITGGARHGVYLSVDVLTEHKDYERYKSKYAEKNIKLKSVFVKTSEDWKKEFIRAQKADFIILNNNSGINDWDKKNIQAFVLKTKSILTVTHYEWMIPYTMLAMTKSPQEQGDWTAQVAQAILQGEKPGDIPVVVNRRWNIYVNRSLMEKTSYTLPSSISTKAVYRNN